MELFSKATDPWIDKYAPKSISELAIHKKKIDEVMKWITKQSFNNRSSSILLMTGPSGCGKTATLHTIPNIEINTWNDESDGNGVTAFTEFLLKSSRYSELDDSHLENKENYNKKKFILIESFPNEFYNEPSILHDLLVRYTSMGKCPLIIIISDSQSMKYSQHWLIPKSLQAKLHIETITFNPIAFTIMKKSIQSIIKKEARYTTEKQQNEIIKNLCEISDGDIRSAINNLQVLLTVKERSRDACQVQMNKDNPLFLFRALGKILYCKRETDQGQIDKSRAQFEAALPHCSGRFRAPPLFSPEDVYDSCGIDHLTFVGYLHENYLDFIEDIDQVTQISEEVSLAESLFNRWKPESEHLFGRYLVSVTTRSMMFHNESRSKNTFRALRKSGLSDLWKKIARVHSSIGEVSESAVGLDLLSARASMSSTSLLCDLLPGLSRLATRRPDIARKLAATGILDELRFARKSTSYDSILAIDCDSIPAPDDFEPVTRRFRKKESEWTVCSQANEDNIQITVDD